MEAGGWLFYYALQVTMIFCTRDRYEKSCTKRPTFRLRAIHIKYHKVVSWYMISAFVGTLFLLCRETGLIIAEEVLLLLQLKVLQLRLKKKRLSIRLISFLYS